MYHLSLRTRGFRDRSRVAGADAVAGCNWIVSCAERVGSVPHVVAIVGCPNESLRVLDAGNASLGGGQHSTGIVEVCVQIIPSTSGRIDGEELVDGLA